MMLLHVITSNNGHHKGLLLKAFVLKDAFKGELYLGR